MPEANRYCPNCGKKTLRHIEDCDADEGTCKTSWTCDNKACKPNNKIVYIYEFKE